MAASTKASIPADQLRQYLSGYRANPLPEYSNGHRHVYFSRPLQRWIIVRRRKGKGDSLELEFVDECPCSYSD